MKKLILVLCAVMLLLFCVGMAYAEDEAPVNDTLAASPGVTEVAQAEAEPFTWKYLATIAGATAATLLIVQFLKLPVDKVWKFPTRILAYMIALVLMIGATYFIGELTWESAALAAVNAFVVALAAMGSYEITFGKAGK